MLAIEKSLEVSAALRVSPGDGSFTSLINSPQTMELSALVIIYSCSVERVMLGRSYNVFGVPSATCEEVIQDTAR